MGLSAVVYKNIATIESEFGEGLYEIDPDTGEVSSLIGSERLLTSEIQLAARRDFGNVAQIGFLHRDASTYLGGDSIACASILYSGSHSGDLIATDKLSDLEGELKQLCSKTELEDVKNFCNDVCALIEFARIEKNPIVFI